MTASKSGVKTMSETIKPLIDYFPGVTFGKGVQVIGIRNTRIGPGSCISDDTWVNVCNRDEDIHLRVGKCVLIGRRNILNTSGDLEIGDYTITGPGTYIGDVDHDYRSNMHAPILMCGVTAGRRIVVEENCWIANNCFVSGNLTVGRGAVIGAASVVTRDVHPFSVVVGSPARIVKMYDPVLNEWVRTPDTGAVERVLENRVKKPLPDRPTLRKILDEKNFTGIPPVVAGNEMHIY
jgi:acetyltransferase-like isoleucine patch superfamily enzyme